MAEDPQVTLTLDQLKEVVGDTVDETLTRLGIEADDHRDMQADMLFLRKLRKTHEAVQNKALVVLVGTLVAGTIGLIIMGIVSWVRSIGGGS